MPTTCPPGTCLCGSEMSTPTHCCSSVVARRRARRSGWFRLLGRQAFMLWAVRRGILGGTFDPLHVVHLMAGEAARNLLDLDMVTFITAGDPYQKAGMPMSPKEQRWRLTELGVADVEYFEADDREVRREGPSYMIDTLDTFPEDEEIFLILGADAAVGLPSWRRWEEVVERTTVAVISRPGVAEEEVAGIGAPYLWLDTPGIPISSTMLRARVEAGRSLRFFVPDPVWRYIADEKLYAVS